jgi:hypothetical protein
MKAIVIIVINYRQWVNPYFIKIDDGTTFYTKKIMIQ